MTTSQQSGLGTSASLPWQGVVELLRGWSGRGQLYAALAASSGQGDDQWSASDVEMRARRILFAEVEPILSKWPLRTSDWTNALPAETVHYRAVEPSPVGRVDWVATRLHGWPPEQFVVRHRQRQSDQLLTTIMKWCLTRLLDVQRDAVRLLPGIDSRVARQVAAGVALLDRSPVREAPAISPTKRDLAAARASGRPWGSLADVAERLLSEDRDLEGLARKMVLPDDDLRWRLFHLGCLGTMIVALKRAGHQVDWLRPLNGVSRGPQFAVKDSRGRTWHLWFESAAMWSWYGATSPYTAVRRSLPGAARPLGADIALVLPGDFALVVECKYSTDVSYVGRNGYEQALAYLSEALSGLVPAAAAAVVGAEDVVARTSTASTIAGKLTVTSPAGLGELVRSVIAEH